VGGTGGSCHSLLTREKEGIEEGRRGNQKEKKRAGKSALVF